MNDTHTPFLMNLSVLLIDNNDISLNSLKSFILQHDGTCCISNTCEQAMSMIEVSQFDVAICDLHLNNGCTCYDFLDYVNKIDSNLTVIVMVAEEVDRSLVELMIKKNFYSVLHKDFNPIQLSMLLLQASRRTRFHRKDIYIAENLRKKVLSIQHERDKVFFNTLTSLTNALETKDPYTKNHSEMVGTISEKICMEYTDNHEFIEDVVTAARLHDIGKIGIRDEILFKNGKLTDEEYSIIKTHPTMSFAIVKPVDTFGKISEIILHHHERYNGSGYPAQLKEKNIPTGSRILAVADTYSALTSNRPYRQAVDMAFALNVLMEGKSIFFDADIVDIMYKIIKMNRI